jgi:hypothetical protein
LATSYVPTFNDCINTLSSSGDAACCALNAMLRLHQAKPTSNNNTNNLNQPQQT